MPIEVNDIPQAIIDGVFKVIRQRQKPEWVEFKDQKVSDLFVGVANPSGWPDFFLEAVAWAVQMELMAHGSFCRDLDARLKAYNAGEETWMDLFRHFRQSLESI